MVILRNLLYGLCLYNTLIPELGLNASAKHDTLLFGDICWSIWSSAVRQMFRVTWNAFQLLFDKAHLLDITLDMWRFFPS